MRLIFTYLFVFGSLLHAQNSTLVNENFLAALRSEAARHHPATASGKLKTAAAMQEVAAVRLWNDPTVGFGLMAGAMAKRADDGDLTLAIEQALPKSGLFAAQRRKAEAQGRAEKQNTITGSLAAAAEATRSAIEIALADEAIQLQQSQIQWLTAMVENARAMAADPTASSTDALRMETELAKEKQLLDAARRTRVGYAQRLNLTLGRPLDDSSRPLRLPATPPPVALAAAEIARIPYANPKVRAMKELAGAAQAETTIADRQRQPEVALALDTQLYSGNGQIQNTTFGLKMNLPWFNEPSYQATTNAAKNRELAATMDIEVMRREISAKVLTTLTEAANAAAQARAYAGEVYEKALAANKATEAAWISSKAPLTDLLDSSRNLFAIRLEQRRMIAIQLAALEELQSLVPQR